MATQKLISAGPTTIEIMELRFAQLHFCILGTSPFICNQMSQKSKEQLLAPAGRKTTVEKSTTMKHNPLEEYRASPYTLSDSKAPALLAVLPTALKGAMSTASLRMPGIKRTEFGQLVRVQYDKQPLFGTPKMMMSVTRSADINKTPDVRTRACLPEWACQLTVTYAVPLLREQSVVNLLAAAGVISGIGDWRQEKGSGSFGSFEIVQPDNEEFNRIIKTQGRKAQLAAMEDPAFYDDETEQLYNWYMTETKRRGFKVVGA